MVLGILSTLGGINVADIVIKCAACGTENKVSEYASAEMLVCIGCHHSLQLPEPVKNPGRLKMRKIETHQADRLTGQVADRSADEKIRIESAAASAAVLGDVHKVRETVKRPHAFWSYLTFLIVCGTLVGLQYMMKERPDLMQTYQWARLGFGVLGAVLLLIVAFQDSTLQGLLCLFVFPYTLYYAAVRLEIYWIQGIFVGVVIALCAEMYFIPGQAFITRAQVESAKFVENVGQGISELSKAPEALPGAPQKVDLRRRR